MQDIITRLRAKKDDEGFTLIELLVVVVIIGVLVAIAVPVYLNYREGAADKSAQSDVRGAISTIEQYYTDMNNTYPTGPTGTANKMTASFTLTPASPSNSRVTLSAKTEMYYVAPVSPSTTYKVCARNTGGSGKYYLYDSGSGGSVTVSTAITAANFATCG
jgi:type IV pilus assembly protein PilA